MALEKDLTADKKFGSENICMLKVFDLEKTIHAFPVNLMLFFQSIEQSF
jgi:hypothetical protein